MLLTADAECWPAGLGCWLGPSDDGHGRTEREGEEDRGGDGRRRRKVKKFSRNERRNGKTRTRTVNENHGPRFIGGSASCLPLYERITLGSWYKDYEAKTVEGEDL